MTAGPADPKALQVLPSWVTGSPVPPGSRIGKVLQNEYLLKGLLGEGELGVTYEAENTRLRGRFAVLMLKRELKPTQGMMLQVRDDLRKAEPLARLGLMPVRMVTDQHQIPGFATELLEGETLRRRLQRGPLRVERALAVALQVAHALAALHKAGAVHGDLRPENLFLVRPAAKSAYAGRVVIVEHSFYHLRRREPGLDDKLPLYKLMYRPPELLLGERSPHPGADVFDLGAILYEAITGKPAFYDEDPDFVLDNLGQPPKPLEAKPEAGLTADLAAQISLLITSACARDPDVRLPEMGEFIAAIDEIVRGAGLKLPEVVVEAPESTPEVAAAPSNQRMARVLERRSGVFATIPVPGAAPAGAPPSPAPTPSPAASSSGPVAPVAAVTPAAPAPEAAKPTVPPVASSEPAARPAETPASPSEPRPNLPQTITAPKKKVTRILQRLSGSFPVLTVSPDGTHIEESLSRPSDPQLAAASSSPPSSEPPRSEPPAPSAPPAVAAVAPKAPEAAPAPVVPAPVEAPAPAAAAISGPAAATVVASAVSAPTASPAAATITASAASPVAPATSGPAAPTLVVGSAEQAPAAPVGSPPRPAGIPADLARALLQSRQKSPVAEAAPVAAPPAAAPSPASASASAAGSAPTPVPPTPVVTPAVPALAAGPAAPILDHPEAHKVTVPPIAPLILPLAAGLDGTPRGPSESGAAATSERPAAEPGVSSGALAPTPPVLPVLSPAAVGPSREITLAGDELIEATESARVTTLSDVPTRPALGPLSLGPQVVPMAAPPSVPTTDVPVPAARLLDQATQPALRRLPITEQATQAKLPALDSISAQPTLAALGAESAPAVAPAAVPPSPPATPASTPATAQSVPQPPRVSQLIKALQRGEMDAVKAITEAARGQSGSVPVVPAAPTASAAQPSVPTPSSPSSGRVSPGLMAQVAPVLPETGSQEAAIATTRVGATNSRVPVAGEGGIKEFLVRHQEALSMVAGAVLMLIVGLVVLAVFR